VRGEHSVDRRTKYLTPLDASDNSGRAVGRDPVATRAWRPLRQLRLAWAGILFARLCVVSVRLMFSAGGVASEHGFSSRFVVPVIFPGWDRQCYLLSDWLNLRSD